MEQIQPMLPTHWERVKTIYEEGIATGDATFQQTAPDWAEWNQLHLPFARLVSINAAGDITGWAALTPVSGRCVYAGVAELSVYIAAAHRGRGIGKQLLLALIEQSEQHQIWTLQAGIFPENKGSMQLHLSCGFRIVGSRERIGQMHGKWRDTILLERRSKLVGT